MVVPEIDPKTPSALIMDVQILIYVISGTAETESGAAQPVHQTKETVETHLLKWLISGKALSIQQLPATQLNFMCDFFSPLFGMVSCSPLLLDRRIKACKISQSFYFLFWKGIEWRERGNTHYDVPELFQ